MLSNSAGYWFNKTVFAGVGRYPRVDSRPPDSQRTSHAVWLCCYLWRCLATDVKTVTVNRLQILIYSELYPWDRPYPCEWCSEAGALRQNSTFYYCTHFIFMSKFRYKREISKPKNCKKTVVFTLVLNHINYWYWYNSFLYDGYKYSNQNKTHGYPISARPTASFPLRRNIPKENGFKSLTEVCND